jgi:hypothetical protein
MSAGATSVSAQRFHAFLDGAVRALEGMAQFDNVRLQLDPYAIDDVLKENFKVPAARLFLLKSDPSLNATSSCDMDMVLAVAIIAGRSGRPDPKLASADLEASGLAFDVMAGINADPYLGMAQLTAVKIDGFRPVLSEKSNDKALAIVIVQLSTTLLQIIPERPLVAVVLDATRSSSTGLTLNADPLIEATP